VRNRVFDDQTIIAPTVTIVQKQTGYVQDQNTSNP